MWFQNIQVTLWDFNSQLDDIMSHSENVINNNNNDDDDEDDDNNNNNNNNNNV